MTTTNSSAFHSKIIREDSGLKIHWPNGISLEFSFRQEVDSTPLLGLSQLTVDGLATMSEDSLRCPYLETRNGWKVESLHFLRVSDVGEGAIAIECEVWGEKPPLGRRTDMFGFGYVTTPKRKPLPLGRLTWNFQIEERLIGQAPIRQTLYKGISYWFAWELKYPFHWMLDAGSWELNGDAHGSTLFSQHLAAIGGPMEFMVDRNGESYTTAETFPKGRTNNTDVFHDTANDPNERYVIPIQAQMRGAGGALLDFQYKDDAALICFYEHPEYYRTLVEYLPENGTQIGHMDAHYFPKATSYQTRPKSILVARQPGLTRLQALDLWTDAHEFVSTRWREETGVQRTGPHPGIGIDSCGAAGTHLGYGPDDILDRWEKRLDWMQERGFKTLTIGNLGEHQGLHTPRLANLCQPYTYIPHERFGGPERFRSFCTAAHARGIKIFHWIIAPSIHAPVLKEHPDWVIRYDNGAPWDGNYKVINAVSLRKGFGDWLLDQLRQLKELGLDGIHIDSYHNLWAMPVDYGQPDLHPQFPDLLALQAKIEKLGLDCWTESFSPVGLTCCGFWKEYGMTPELAYQTHFAALANDHVAKRPNSFRNGTITPEFYWRMVANKAPLRIDVMDLADEPFEGNLNVPEEIFAMLKAYNTLLPYMEVRTLQENGTVVWNDPVSGRGALFHVGSILEVPEGFQAVPVYGFDQTLPSGRRELVAPAAFLLEPL